jgi:hypothetical protein
MKYLEGTASLLGRGMGGAGGLVLRNRCLGAQQSSGPYAQHHVHSIVVYRCAVTAFSVSSLMVSTLVWTARVIR